MSADTVERMITDDWQRVKPISTHLCMPSTTSPSVLLAQSSSVVQKQPTASLWPPEERTIFRVSSQPATWQPNPRLELPLTSVTSLPLPIHAGSRDTQEITSSARCHAQMARVASSAPLTSQLQLIASPRYHQNGDSSTSLKVAGWTSTRDVSGGWASDEQRLETCESELPATTAATDVW